MKRILIFMLSLILISSFAGSSFADAGGLAADTGADASGTATSGSGTDASGTGTSGSGTDASGTGTSGSGY